MLLLANEWPLRDVRRKLFCENYFSIYPTFVTILASAERRTALSDNYKVPVHSKLKDYKPGSVIRKLENR